MSPSMNSIFPLFLISLPKKRIDDLYHFGNITDKVKGAINIDGSNRPLIIYELNVLTPEKRSNRLIRKFSNLKTRFNFKN